ncbi:MAG TPA: VanW family protein [Pseudobacteroides sp.]|uniref:VanW family protein n=1 Tax=Pseudobacteroides sp. TaxID=1968840 RepID=UPI002F947054
MIKERLKLISLLIISFLLLLLVSCSAHTPSDKGKLKSAEPQNKMESQKRMSAEGNPGILKETEKNLTSGVATQVPWENDEGFKSAQQKKGTSEMLAAYRTVLKDPLSGEEENVHLAARYLAGNMVEPGQVFSQNRQIGPYTEERGFKTGPTYSGANLVNTVGGGVCKIASTLYNVVVLSNLQVVERHNHSMPVPYVPYGQDATVFYGQSDFKFKNDTGSPILIWAQGIDNILYIGFYSKEKAPRVEWHHEITNKQAAPTIYRNNTLLPANSEKKVAEGMDGATVKSWVTIEKQDGTKTDKQLGKSYYKPFPNIVEKGIVVK